jgi:hypothetical protein
MACLLAGSELITQQEFKDSTEMRRLFWGELKRRCKQQDNPRQLVMAESIISLLCSTKTAASLTYAFPQSYARMVVRASPLLV